MVAPRTPRIPPPPPPANIQDLLVSQFARQGHQPITMAPPSPASIPPALRDLLAQRAGSQIPGPAFNPTLNPSPNVGFTGAGPVGGGISNLPQGASAGMDDALGRLRSTAATGGRTTQGILGQIRNANVGQNLAGAGGVLGFGLKRAVPGYLAATAPQGIIESAVPGENSLLEQVIQGGFAGGALGGIAGAPLLGIGALPGAALGAAAGGLTALVGSILGRDEPPKAKLQEIFASTALPQEIRQELQLTYDILSQTSDEETALQQVGQLALQRIQESRAQDDQLQRTLATQMLASQFIQPFTEQLLDTANTRAGVVEQLLPSLPPEYRPVALNSASSQLSSAQRLASAYAAQTQFLPGTEALRQQQSAMSQAAAQQLSQAMAGGGAGGGTLADLITQYTQGIGG